MSAIWGQIDLLDNKIEYHGRMKRVFESKCKLESVEEIYKNSIQLGTGVQYIHEYDKKERQPLYHAMKKTYFLADCIVDNREELIEEIKQAPGLWKALQAEFEGVAPEDYPSGSILYYLFLKDGIEFAKKVIGLFSIVIYDEKRKICYLISDPTASRSLYYGRIGDRIYFSTLLDAIRAVAKKLEVNQQYYDDYFMVPGLIPNLVSNDTPFEGIFKCNPGCIIEISKEDMKEFSYFDYEEEITDCNFDSAEETGVYFRSLLEKCVSDAIQVDGEVGAALSSGFDSASVSMIAAKELSLKNKNLYAYTYVPAVDNNRKKQKGYVYDETEDVKRICKPFTNIKNRFICNAGRNACQQIDELVALLEIPFKAFVNLPNLLEIYENAGKENCKVVLTGQFGNGSISYGRIDDILFDLWFERKWMTFFKDLSGYCKLSGESRKWLFLNYHRYFRKLERQVKRGRGFSYRPTQKFLSREYIRAYPCKERFLQGNMKIVEDVPLNRDCYLEGLFKKAIFTYLGEIETKLGLANGVVLRDPTRDARILRFCHQMPYEYFCHEGMERWLIRSQMTDLIPKEILFPLNRYGVQNADWFERVKRDWNSSALYEKFMKDLSLVQVGEGENSHLVCIKKDLAEQYDVSEIEKYLTKLSEGDVTEKNQWDFSQLMFVWIAQRCKAYSTTKVGAFNKKRES